MCWLTADWVTQQRVAAILNNLVSATFTNERKCLSSINPISFSYSTLTTKRNQKIFSNYKITDIYLIWFRFGIRNANFSIILSDY